MDMLQLQMNSLSTVDSGASGGYLSGSIIVQELEIYNHCEPYPQDSARNQKIIPSELFEL